MNLRKVFLNKTIIAFKTIRYTGHVTKAVFVYTTCSTNLNGKVSKDLY